MWECDLHFVYRLKSRHSTFYNDTILIEEEIWNDGVIETCMMVIEGRNKCKLNGDNKR